jgi:WD40 repeat protein
MVLKGHTNSVHQLCWDPTHPEYLATASADKTVRIWDTRSAFPIFFSPPQESERSLVLARAQVPSRHTPSRPAVQTSTLHGARTADTLPWATR